MTTAIIGVGNLGGTVARHLVTGGEPVVLAAQDEAHAVELARQLGPRAEAAALAEEAIASSDVVVLALWLDQIREVVPEHAHLLEDKIVVDPSNPIGFENGQMIRTLPAGESSGSVVAGLLPASAHYVKAFGTLGAVEQLATSANLDPRVVLFYATDDDTAEAAAQRLIRTAGFDPLKVGGVSDAGRIEGPDGELQGQIFDLDAARATVATEGAKA